MGEVVDDEDVGGGEEDGGDVADDDLAVEVVQLGDGTVDDEGDQQEEAGDASTDGVDHPQDAARLEYQSFLCCLGNGNLNVGNTADTFVQGCISKGH